MELYCIFCQQRVTPAKQASVFSNIRQFRQEQFAVWRCPLCQSIHRLEDIDLEPYYKNYPTHDSKLDDWTRLSKQKLLKTLVKGGLTKAHRFLDFGCGAGVFLDYMKEKGYSNLNGYDLYHPNYNDPGVLTSGYDFILAEEVLEHQDQPDKLLKQWYSLLNKGGRLLITTPNAAAIDLDKQEDYLFSLHQPYHPHVFSPQALTKMAEALSFHVVRFYKRGYYDTLIPSINYSFMLHYIKAMGNVMVVGSEIINYGLLFSHPSLIFYAFFGYFFPNYGAMMMLLEKK